MAKREVVIEHPNRDKASSKITKTIVLTLLLGSAVLVALVTYGGWDALAGAQAVQIFIALLFLVIAVFVARWNRGVLPVAAAVAMITLIFAAVSAPQWFDRSKDGFTDPTFDASLLGMLTLIIVGVQVALIVFALQGFAQAWNIEVERVVGERRDPEPTPA